MQAAFFPCYQEKSVQPFIAGNIRHSGKKKVLQHTFKSRYEIF